MSLLLSFQPRLGPTLVKKLRVKRPMSRQLDYFSSHAATIPFQPLMLPTTSKPKNLRELMPSLPRFCRSSLRHAILGTSDIILPVVSPKDTDGRGKLCK